MSGKLLGVEGLTIGHSSGSLVSGGMFSITSLPSLKVKCEGKGVYRGVLTFMFSAGNHSSGVPGSALGSGTINVTAQKTKADHQLVIRAEDTGTIIGTYVPPSGIPPTIPFTSNVEITDAGQTKVKGA